ncbi:MAG: hypothetical protein AAGA03_07290, partial [Planctomycetota bacterium]
EQEHDHFVLQTLLDDVRNEHSDRDLTIFHRLVIDGDPVREIANDMNMTLGAVRVVQHRVTKTLKTLAAGLVD